MASMRSIWKGHISVGLMTVPVKVFNGVNTADRISFNQLHGGKCLGRVGHEKKCRKCGDIVDQRDIVKGYEHTTNEYVTITDDDLSSIRLKSTKVVEVQGFVPADSIAHIMVDAPYYIAPDGKVANQAYHLIARTLAKRKVVGVGKIVLRDREDAVAIAPASDGKGLVMLKLRQPNEIRDFSDVPGVEDTKVDKGQLALASTLVDSMSTTMDKLDLVDGYRDALRKMVEAKVNKREITVVAADDTRSTAPADIMDILQASINRASKRKTA